MNRYTIYCTPEQTKKALELGAPIQYASVREVKLKRFIYLDRGWYTFPTAEEMIGWLEEQGVFVSILYGYNVSDKWAFDLDGKEYYIDCKSGEFDSRKEATLAAIDATLEYLHRKAMEDK